MNIWNCIKAWFRKIFLFEKEVADYEPDVKLVRIRLGKGFYDAELIKENIKTVWVKLFDEHIIKRHKKKHVIVI